MSIRSAIVVLLVGGAGCSFNADFSGTHYMCVGIANTCPPGYTCVNQECVSGTPDGSSEGPDAPGALIDSMPTPDAGPTLAACGAMEILHDDFGDGVVSTAWPWGTINDTGTTTTESGGDLIVSIAAGSGDVWGGYGSTAVYDLTESQLQVAVNAIGGQDTLIEIRSYYGEKAQMVVEAGQLLAAVYNTATPGQRAAITYDAATMPYWRIREHAGRMYWEYSSDRTNWQHLWDEADPFEVTDDYAYVTAGGQLASPSAAHFDDVNQQGTTLAYCGADTIHDDFTSGQFDPKWGWWDDAGCTIAESGGDLVMTYDGTTTANCFTGIATSHRYDLTNSSVVFDAKTIPAVIHFITYVAALDPADPNNNAHLEMGLDFGDGTGQVQIYFEEANAANTNIQSGTAVYDAVNMRYWRLRGAAGRFYVDTSPDGTTWVTQMNAPAQIDLSNATIELGAGNYTTTSATTVRFGSVN